MDSPDLGHDRPDKTSKVKDDANGQRSQDHREAREVDRTTIVVLAFLIAAVLNPSVGYQVT